MLFSLHQCFCVLDLLEQFRFLLSHHLLLFIDQRSTLLIPCIKKRFYPCPQLLSQFIRIQCRLSLFELVLKPDLSFHIKCFVLQKSCQFLMQIIMLTL